MTKKIMWMISILLVASLFKIGGMVQAATYWASVNGAPLAQGVRARDISVCFVGNAVTIRPDRVQQILDYIKEFEYAANIKFDYWGKCPDPIPHPNNPNDDYHDGDIRVVIPGIDVSRTGPIPGDGCPAFNQLGPGGYNGENDGRSWGNEPWLLEAHRPCLYNLNLGDEGLAEAGQPWLNHTLHEFGHSLGLSHEHQRNDATCYDPKNDTRVSSQGYMTPYDRNSVMHYSFSLSEGHTCDVDGNFANSGLSDWDKLALHIMYPEDNRVAEFVGKTVIRAGETLNLQSAWKARGANMDFVAGNFHWKLNGVIYSATPELVTTLNTPGDYTLELTHDDFLGRNYAYTGLVRVLEPSAYDQLVAGVNAANQLMMVTDGSATASVPTSGGTFVLAPEATFVVNPGAFAGTAVIQYDPQPASDTGSQGNVGLFYQLEAVDPLDGRPVSLQAGQTYTIALTYQADSVTEGLNEADLALYFWDEGRWVKEKTSVVDAGDNTVTATPNHFSQWAVLAESEQPTIYLPMVLR